MEYEPGGLVRRIADREAALSDLLTRVSYKAGWRFGLDPGGRLAIRIQVTDSLSGHRLEVCHMGPTPPTAMNERTLRRWLFERILLVERHEAMEFFKVDGEAPYFPDHTPGGDPYALVDRDVPGEAGSSTAGLSDWRLPERLRSILDSPPPG